MRTSIGGVEPVADLIELVGDADAVDAVQAGGGEAEAGREAEAQAFGKLPADERRDVVRGVAQGEGGGVAEAAVGFSAGDELLRAEGAGAAAGSAAQGAGGADGVAELPWLVAQILFGDEVFGDVPVLDVGGEDELEFGLVLVLAAGVAVGSGQVGLAVVADDFEDGLVGAGDVFVLDVEDRVDDVVAHERADAVLDAEAGKDGRILRGGLAIEIELGGPPGADAVFEFQGGGAVVGAAVGAGQGGFGFDFEVAGLLQVVGVGDEVGLLLGAGSRGEQARDRQKPGDSQTSSGLKAL